MYASVDELRQRIDDDMWLFDRLIKQDKQTSDG